MLRTIMAIIILMNLFGCAVAGISDLEINSFKEKMVVNISFRDAARRFEENLRNERFNIAEIAVVPTGQQNLPDGNSVEIVCQHNGVFYYVVTFKEVGLKMTEVNLISRKKINPYFGERYLVNKLLNALNEMQPGK